jgi:hypothetical protein
MYLTSQQKTPALCANTGQAKGGTAQEQDHTTNTDEGATSQAARHGYGGDLGTFERLALHWGLHD